MATGRLPDPNTAPVTAKGDLYTYSTVPAKLAVGSNGETLVADSSATTGLRWGNNYGFTAGKNKIINGDFGIWQRGTSFTVANTYMADRWFANTNATFTASRQTFTPGTAPVAGYEGQYFFRMDKSAGGSFVVVAQRIEDVRTFAGQTVTISFWAKVGSGTVTIEPYVDQNFGSGGSATVGAATTTVTATTSWQRFSIQYSVPSVSSKTIGASSFIEFSIGRVLSASAFVLDLWGVQVEVGSVATAFQTATGTLAGELAACQRYYFRNSANATDTYAYFGQGFTNTTTNARMLINLPVTMRVKPTSVDFTNLGIQEQFAGNIFAVSAISIGGDGGGPNPVFINATCATATGTKYSVILSNGSSTGYLGFSAEL